MAYMHSCLFTGVYVNLRKQHAHSSAESVLQLLMIKACMADWRAVGVAHLKVRAVEAFGYLLEEWNHDFGKFSCLQIEMKGLTS